MRCRITCLWLALIVVGCQLKKIPNSLDDEIIDNIEALNNERIADIITSTTNTANIESTTEKPSASTVHESSTTEAEVTPTQEPVSSTQTTEDGNNDEGILIPTKAGIVRGYKWQRHQDIIGFIDIPYGVINNPFGIPTAIEAWEGVHDEKEHTKICLQLDRTSDKTVGELNCLTLSIFAPTEAENASVLFHIHDSSKRSADPNIYGPENLVSKGIIVVLPNYRVGAPGFLCLRNDNVPGNAGLRDLTLALQWIYDNIKSFGGNSSNIVVSGDGSAGALVGYLTMYQPARSHIRTAISESGSVLSPWAIDRNPLTTAAQIANNLIANSTQDINSLIENATLSEILIAAKHIKFAPCISGTDNDNYFINSSPWQTLQGDRIDTTFMIGSASHAGTHDALEIIRDPGFLDKLDSDFSLIFPEDLKFENDDDKLTYARMIKSQYFGNKTITADHLMELTLCLTDALYWSPAIRLARSLVKHETTVYLYEFDYVGELNIELDQIDRPIEGAVRSDIVGYLFKQKGIDVEPGSNEQAVVESMVELFTSFIDKGEPLAQNLNWTKFKSTSASEEDWLHITSSPKMMKGVHVDRLSVWTNIYEEHYIERSSSVSLTKTPRNYAAFSLATLFIVLYTKTNY